mgnify:CR=1
MLSNQLEQAISAIKREANPLKQVAAVKKILSDEELILTVDSDVSEVLEVLDALVRLHCANERGIVLGKRVMYSRVALPAAVRGFTEDAHVLLEGVNCVFNPRNLIVLH